MDTADFNPEATEAALWTGQQLSDDHRTYLDALPAQLLAGPAGEFTLVHGSPREPIWEYLTHVSIARLNFDYFHTPYCLVGHTHVPLIFQRPLANEKTPQFRTLVPSTGAAIELGEHRLIFNPGSVGQPRDGNPAAAYMIFDSTASGAGGAGALTMRRVEYPVPAVQEKMRAAQLPSRLIVRLTYGW